MNPFDYWKLLTGPGKWWTEESTDTQYRFHGKGDELHIHFQAASSKIDWRMAFWFILVRMRYLPRGRAHAGFLKKWTSIANDVVIRAAHYKTIKLYGYSKGGAIATLAYLYFKECFPEKEVEAVIFGNPRVISWNIKTDEFNIVRVVNSGDLVCNLPPFLFGYKHIGSRIRMGKWRIPAPWHHGDWRYRQRLEELEL